MAKSKIIKELANNDISLEVALNRLMIIASDIENEELSQWAERELNGYKMCQIFRYIELLPMPDLFTAESTDDLR